MKNHFRLWFALCVTLSACTSAPPSVPAVEPFLQHYIETLESREEPAVIDLFVDDDRFAWYTDGALSYSSPDHVLSGMKAYKDLKFATTLSNITVLPLSERSAYASSEFETTLSIPNAEDYVFGGVITWLLEFEDSGNRWRVISGHTSTPGGPPQ